VPLQSAQDALGVVLAERQPPGEIGHFGGAHGHQCPVRRLVRLVQTCRSQHQELSLPKGKTRGFVWVFCLSSDTPFEKGRGPVFRDAPFSYGPCGGQLGA
jgi:hypothetical protein